MNRIQSGYFIVDNGLIEQITTCPWKAYVTQILNKRTADESAALRFGRHIHTALAYRNRMEFYHARWTEEMQVKILTNRFTLTPLEYEGWRNLDSAVKVIKGYNAESTCFNPTTNHCEILSNPTTGCAYIEQPFAVDTHKTIEGFKVVYIGRIDRKVRLPDGVFIRDYKTTSVLGDTTWSEAQMSEQLKGYCWADRELSGEEPMGYCYDVLAVRESIGNAVWDDVLGKIVPPPTKSGAPGKAIPLTFESQRFFTREPAGQLDEWFENMLHQVETFLWHVKRGIFPRHHKHCVGKYGQCEFLGVCSLPERSREASLKSNAFKNNEWTPLYRR